MAAISNDCRMTHGAIRISIWSQERMAQSMCSATALMARQEGRAMMRTLARGNSAGGGWGKRATVACNSRRKSAGFTLIEMLVVLMIAGLLIAVVTLAPARNRRTDLDEEAQRLATLLESADDEAQIRSVSIAWEPTNGGYAFYERTEGGRWRPLVDDLLKPYHWA